MSYLGPICGVWYCNPQPPIEEQIKAIERAIEHAPSYCMPFQITGQVDRLRAALSSVRASAATKDNAKVVA